MKSVFLSGIIALSLFLAVMPSSAATANKKVYNVVVTTRTCDNGNKYRMEEWYESGKSDPIYWEALGCNNYVSKGGTKPKIYSDQGVEVFDYAYATRDVLTQSMAEAINPYMAYSSKNTTKVNSLGNTIEYLFVLENMNTVPPSDVASLTFATQGEKLVVSTTKPVTISIVDVLSGHEVFGDVDISSSYSFDMSKNPAGCRYTAVVKQDFPGIVDDLIIESYGFCK